MSYYRRRTTTVDEKQYYRDKEIAIWSIVGFVFILFVLMATIPFLALVFFIVACIICW